MKEKYIKPTLSIEMFSMAQSIARDCSDNLPLEFINFNDIPQCKWDLGGNESLFTLAGNICTIEGETSGYICYNNPTGDTLIFRS